jgi:hypothetical protein
MKLNGKRYREDKLDKFSRIIGSIQKIHNKIVYVCGYGMMIMVMVMMIISMNGGKK